MQIFLDLLRDAAERHASDLHLAPGLPPVFRIHGSLVRRDGDLPLNADTIAQWIFSALPEMTRAALAEGALSSADTVLRLDEGSGPGFHLTALRTQGQWTATIRLLMDTIPPLDLIGGDQTARFREIAALPRGLVLITGPTGSGKMTTAVSLIEEINRTRTERIFVLEEQAGYTYRSQQSILTTLQIGQDFESYERAAQAVMKADADVILFGDLPTREAARHALTLADTGHLVVAVLGADSAAQAVADLLAAFANSPGAIPSQLARTLVAVFNQRLLPRASGKGRVAAYEELRATPILRALIRRSAGVDELQTAMDDGIGEGQNPLNAVLSALVASGAVTEAESTLHRADRVRSAPYPQA